MQSGDTKLHGRMVSASGKRHLFVVIFRCGIAVYTAAISSKKWKPFEDQGLTSFEFDAIY